MVEKGFPDIALAPYGKKILLINLHGSTGLNDPDRLESCTENEYSNRSGQARQSIEAQLAASRTCIVGKYVNRERIIHLKNSSYSRLLISLSVDFNKKSCIIAS
jgi:hypothetical protein